MSDSDVLNEMVNSLPDTIQKLQDSIDSLDDMIDDLNAEISAIENEVLVPMTTASNEYLTQKALSFGFSYSACTSGSYGDSNLTDWAIVFGNCFGVHTVVFTSNDVSPTVDAEQYYRQVDFEEAYGHIHDEVGVNGTYGIEDKISNINTGKGILETNKSKYETVLAIYEQYV